MGLTKYELDNLVTKLNLANLELNSTDELKNLFAELSQEILRTEDAITHISDALNCTLTSPINELRYCGNHITTALSGMQELNGKFTISHSQVVSAKNHCVRAYYDAFDWALTSVRVRFKTIRDAYFEAGLALYEIAPDARVWKNKVNELTSIRATSKTEFLLGLAQNDTKREHYYKQLELALIDIWRIENQLPDLENDLAFYGQRREKEEERAEKAEKRAEKAEERAEKSEVDAKKNLKYLRYTAGGTIALAILTIPLAWVALKPNEQTKAPIQNNTPIIENQLTPKTH
jgi:chromosome segregation ATPase